MHKVARALMYILIHCARWPPRSFIATVAGKPVILCCVVDREILHTCEIVASAHVIFFTIFHVLWFAQTRESAHVKSD